MHRSTFITWGIFIGAIFNVGILWLVLTGRLEQTALLGSLGLALLVGTGTSVLLGISLRSDRRSSRVHTDLALTQTKLAEQSQAIDSFADGLDLAIFICDQSGTVTYSNRTAREMFNFPLPVGRSILAITLSYDLEQTVLRSAKDGCVQTREIAFTGSVERVAMVKAWFNDKSSHTFVSVLDVTNLRRLERVRQDFVANVSHELRTPMAILRASAETLLDEADPSDQNAQKYLPKMLAEIDRLTGLISDLLILSTAELEPVKKQSCNLSAIVEQVVHQLLPKAEKKGLSLEIEEPAELVLKANAAQMTQVVLNLVDNALNYTLKGAVCVSLREEEDAVVLSVRDTGIGIASDHVHRVFERFYRVDKGRSRSTGGTGLGLSIVKHIVEAHHGTLTVVSTLQKGSEFTVRLPKEQDVSVSIQQ